MRIVPNSWGSLKEFNQCHDAQGRFCSSPGVTLISPQHSLLPPGGVHAPTTDSEYWPYTITGPGPTIGNIEVVYANYPEGLDAKLFGKTPIHEVAQRLAAHLPGKPVKVRYISNDENAISIYLSGDGVTQKRTFSVNDYGVKKLEHDTFLLSPGKYRQGMAKVILQEAFALYRELGYTRVDMHANIDVGGYAWARYGWHPEDIRAYRMVAATTQSLFEDYLSGRQSQIQQYFDHSVAGNRSVLVSTTLSAKAKSAIGKLLDRIEQGDRRAFWALADAEVTGTREDGRKVPFKIGKWLLQSTAWRGTLNMNDPATMRRFRRYVGGRR